MRRTGAATGAALCALMLALGGCKADTTREAVAASPLGLMEDCNRDASQAQRKCRGRGHPSSDATRTEQELLRLLSAGMGMHAGDGQPNTDEVAEKLASRLERTTQR